jgi:WD40 repeat protein
VTRLSNIADGKFVAEFAGPAKGAMVLAFSPDGKVLFAGGESPVIFAWEVAGGKEVVRLGTGADGAVMAFGDGGAAALTANGEERLQVWETKNKRPAVSLSIQDPRGGSVRCEAATFSPEGRLIASSQISEYQGIRPSYGADEVRLWERFSGEPIHTLAPSVTKLLAFSPNGRLLAFGRAGKSGHLRVGYGSGIDIRDTLTGEIAGTLDVSPECIAFSPDGSRLATGGRDHNVLIWESPAIPQRKKGKEPSSAEYDAWWPALGGDAKVAYEAIGRMSEAPERGVALLKERVRPIHPRDTATVAKLLARLDSDTFAEREKAQRDLAKMGDEVEYLLREAIRGDVSAELHLRVRKLLKKYDTLSPLGKQHYRAVIALEWIGTPAARALLRSLAEGAPGARLTVESRAALKRLEP